MNSIVKLITIIICICISNIYAQNFQLGISTKVLTNTSNLGGDEWDFQSDKWELLLNKTDLTCKFSGITKKIANIKLDLKVQVVGSTIHH